MSAFVFRTLLLASLAACQPAGAQPKADRAPLEPVVDEPITGTPAQPDPGDETEVKDPFEPMASDHPNTQ